MTTPESDPAFREFPSVPWFEEVQSAADCTIRLSPEEQLAVWIALQELPKLTPAQRRLGALMRGES